MKRVPVSAVTPSVVCCTCRSSLSSTPLTRWHRHHHHLYPMPPLQSRGSPSSAAAALVRGLVASSQLKPLTGLMNPSSPACNLGLHLPYLPHQPRLHGPAACLMLHMEAPAQPLCPVLTPASQVQVAGHGALHRPDQRLHRMMQGLAAVWASWLHCGSTHTNISNGSFDRIQTRLSIPSNNTTSLCGPGVVIHVHHRQTWVQMVIDIRWPVHAR